jgi:2-alkenal reductase
LIGVSFVLAYPENNISKSIIASTPLRSIAQKTDSKSSNSSTGTSQTQSSQKSISDQSVPPTNQPFQFVSDTTAKTTTQVVEDVLPSVLSISVIIDRNGFEGEVSGTGYIVSEDGLVLTNKHVIAQKCQNNTRDVKITALSHDQKAYQLDLLSVDPVDDIAILKIQRTDNEKFNAVSFADSNKLSLGSDVIAIGNVLGELQNTVTKGIISGLGRSLETTVKDECTGQTIQPDGLIQTDAAINKGNSGGPLFDAAGNVIGMNTFGTSDAQNIGLAISSNTLVSVLNSYKKNSKIVRPRLGVVTRPIYPNDKLQYPWLPVDYGEIVWSSSGDSVDRESAAFQAGLRKGDVIVEIDGQKVQTGPNNISPLRRLILSKDAGQEIELGVIKAEGGEEDFSYNQKITKVKVKLGTNSWDVPKVK